MNLLLNNCLAVLNNIGRWFCNSGTNIFIQSGILIILLLIIDFLLRKRVRATFRYWIWMLVLLKLMLPPAFTLPTGIGRWFGDYIPAQTSISQQISNTARLKPAGASAPQDPSFSGENPQVHLSQASPEPAAPAIPVISDSQALTWQAVVFLIWFTGAAALSMLLIHRILFVRRLIAQSMPAKDRYAGILDQCRQKLDIKRKTEIRLSGKLQSPAVCGFFRPVILMPHGLVEKLSPDRLRAVLIHELAHIKRGDLWVNCLQTFLQIVYFYNPLLWLANAVIRRIREQAVDEMVLVALGAGANSYSNTLIDIAEMSFLKTSLSLRLIGVVESKKALRKRIKHIINHPIPKSAKLGALGMVLIVLSAAVLLPMAKVDKGNSQAAKTNQAKEQFTATLPNGVKIELVGICEHPSEGKQWWRPDGSKLSWRPFEKLYQRNYQKPGFYELALKIENPENRKFRIISKGGNVFNLYSDQIWGGLVLSEGKKILNQSIGISQGPWKTIMQANPMHTQSFGDIAFGKVFESDVEGIGVAASVTATFTKDEEKVDYRIIAVDQKSNIHTSSRSSGMGNNLWMQTTIHFKDLRIDEIKEFQFQTRPYQWVEFKNVSLKPNFRTDMQIENEGSDVLKVPSDRYPTIHSAVNAAKEGDKIVLDSKDYALVQNMPDVQTEERRKLKTILLPDFDSKALMLDLASGELVKVPKADTPEGISSAIDKLNKGDLIFDASSLILVRRATCGSLPETTGPFNTYRIGSRLPEIFKLKTREGVEWTIEIQSMDKDGCRLRYYPVHPNNYVSAIPLTTLQRGFFKQVLELFKQVEKKYPEHATHTTTGSHLYHVDAQGRVTIWCYQRLGHGSRDFPADEVGWGSSRLVDAMGMYYLPDGTPLQSRWRERGGGMKDIRVKIGRVITEDERIGLIHRYELPSDNDLYSRDRRERKIMIQPWKSLPVAIIVRIDKPYRLSSWALGDVEADIQNFDEYDKMLITAPPENNTGPMLVTIQLP